MRRPNLKQLFKNKNVILDIYPIHKFKKEKVPVTTFQIKLKN